MRLRIAVEPVDLEPGPASFVKGEAAPLRMALQDHWDECPLPPDAGCLPCVLHELSRRAEVGEWR